MKTRVTRPNVTAVRLSDAELAAVQHAAEIAGLSVSDWMRSALAEKASRPILITVNGVRVS